MAASLLVLWLRCGFTSRVAALSGVKVAATAVIVALAAVCGANAPTAVFGARGPYESLCRQSAVNYRCGRL